MKYDYCIMMDRYPQEPHRVPPDNAPALEWCKKWLKDWDEISPNARPGVFHIARRPVGGWEKVSEER